MLYRAIALAACLAGCGSSEFAGQSAKPQPALPSPSASTQDVMRPSPTVPTVKPPLVAPPPVAINGDCDQNGVTVAKLLTPTIDIQQANTYLDYEISRADCEGKIQAFAADKILFDMDAYGMTSLIRYQIIGGSGASGFLTRVDGSDLFNHTGPQWAHYVTGSTVSASSTTRSVVLRVFLGGMQLSPREDRSTGSARAQSYLRFGNAAAVQVDVTIINPTPYDGPTIN